MSRVWPDGCRQSSVISGRTTSFRHFAGHSPERDIDHIRLTRKEVERLTKITGFEPVNVKTLEDLDAFIAQCKRYYWGASRDTQFLHWLIDKERSCCIGGR